MTVLEVIQRGAEFLAKRGVDSPRLQVELLLAHRLKIPRLKLYLDFERPLSEADVTALREMVAQRGDRVPLQHIVGTACFYGLDFLVGPDVLVPRPETELLVEKAIAWLNQRAALRAEPLAVLDVGTGSGCIAITVAKQYPQIAVQAVDVSAPALSLARHNASRIGVAERVTFIESDGLRALSTGLRFDLILSNPPYIATGEIEGLEPEVREHDPRLALDGGTDGLTFYRRLASELEAVLQPHGCVMLELGDGQASAVAQIFVEEKWIVEAVYPDYSAQPRVLVAKRV